MKLKSASIYDFCNKLGNVLEIYLKMKRKNMLRLFKRVKTSALYLYLSLIKAYGLIFFVSLAFRVCMPIEFLEIRLLEAGPP